MARHADVYQGCMCGAYDCPECYPLRGDHEFCIICESSPCQCDYELERSKRRLAELEHEAANVRNYIEMLGGKI